MNNLIKSFKSLKWYEWIMIAIMIIIAGWTMIKAFLYPESSQLPPWLTVINFISAICGVVCIFFCAKASISNYAFGIINTIVYAIYLGYRHIYGTLCLELLLYFPINIMGWIMWAKHRDEENTEKTKVKKLSLLKDILSVIGVVIVAGLCYFFLNKIDGTTPLLDAFTVGVGIMATILQFLRYREQYVWWITQDMISVGMYIVAFDSVYLTKKSIYLIMDIIGLYNWIKLQKTRNIDNI